MYNYRCDIEEEEEEEEINKYIPLFEAQIDLIRSLVTLQHKIDKNIRLIH